MTTVSLELRGAPGITMSGTPQGLRSWVVAGTAVASGLIYLIRKRCSDGIRRRVIRRLDIIAPRKRIDDEMLNSGLLFNTDCPVCLCNFAKLERGQSKCIRILECGHALCAACLEAWATHCTKAHLNPCRFGITRNGRVVSWTPGPKCPLCCARLNCVPREDLKQAIIAAIGHRGVALSTYVALNGNNNNHSHNHHHHHHHPHPHHPHRNRHNSEAVAAAAGETAGLSLATRTTDNSPTNTITAATTAAAALASAAVNIAAEGGTSVMRSDNQSDDVIHESNDDDHGDNYFQLPENTPPFSDDAAVNTVNVELHVESNDVHSLSTTW